MIDEDGIQGLHGLVKVGGHRHALAGCQPISLDDYRRPVRAHIGLGCLHVVEDLIVGGRDPMPAHQILGKALGSFDAGRSLGRTKGGDAGNLQVVYQPSGQRGFGSDEDPVDPQLVYSSDQLFRLRGIHLQQADAVRLHAGVARGAPDMIHSWPGQQGGGDNVLPGSRPDDQYLVRHNGLLSLFTDDHFHEE